MFQFELRATFFIFFGAVTLLTCFLFVTFIQFILFCTVKQLNNNLYYRINYYLFYSLTGLIVFYIDWLANSELYLYMNKNDFEKYYGKESIFCISNHRSEFDILFTMSLLDKIYMLSSTKMFVKNVSKFIPGATMRMSDYPILSRDFEKDKETIEKTVQTVMNYPYHIVLAMAPEGTRFTKEKYAASEQYAEENDLPILKHHLTPRTKGFVITLPHLRNKNIAIYSITWAYEPNEPEIFDTLFHGKKIIAYCHIKRILLSDVPENEEEASKFMQELFQDKDELVDRFFRYGDFCSDDEKDKVTKIKLKGYLSLVIGIFWHIFIIGMLLLSLYHLILNGYVVLFSTVLFAYGSTIPFALVLISSLTMKTASSYGLQDDNTKLN